MDINCYAVLNFLVAQKKIKFQPSKEIIKSNEKLIIDNNDDFIVLNKNAGISVQGGTKSKKNLDKLEKAILLQADSLNLKANPSKKASGVIVE